MASGDEPSLEAIARAAGVGIGTLYRHFPTREDLVAAVYATELESVLSTMDGLLATHPADVALREFMRNYSGFIATKRGMAETVRAGALRSAAAAADTRRRVNEVIALCLAAGAKQGTLGSAVEADDVTAAMIGVFLSTAQSTDTDQADRLLDLLMRGLRPGE